MVFVAFISATPIDDTLQLLQREMKEMKNHYEKIEQKLDSMSGSLISSHSYITKLDSLPCLLSEKSVGFILSNQHHGKTKSLTT